MFTSVANVLTSSEEILNQLFFKRNVLLSASDTNFIIYLSDGLIFEPQFFFTKLKNWKNS